MKKLQLLVILLRPSLLSFSVAALLATMLLLVANWTQVIQSPLLYDYLFGQHGLVTSLQNTPDSVAGFWQAIVGGSLTYNVVILILAAAVGLLVYGVLEGLDRLIMGTNVAWKEMHARDDELRKEVTVKVGFRIASLAAWLIYLMFSIKIIIPFCILSFRAGVDSPFTRAGAEYNLIGIGVLLLAIHVHVILLRFITLRIRIFGTRPELYS